MKPELEKAASLAREAVRCVVDGIADESKRPRAMESMREHSEYVTPLVTAVFVEELQRLEKRVADLEHDLANAKQTTDNMPTIERMIRNEVVERIATRLEKNAGDLRAAELTTGADHFTLAAEFVRKWDLA